MKNMENKILIDTNILLDYFLKREPFYQYAKKIISLCKSDEIQGCIASHSISNMFFILRKEYSSKERRILLLDLCLIFTVIDINKSKLINSLKNEDFTDFEDCLQMECAKEFDAKYIITRNIDDYKTSEIPSITPKEYLEIIER
jgi:predicted nucleic acid-binding protein